MSEMELGPDDESAWSATLGVPATRGEVLRALEVTHLALVSQSLVNIAVLNNFDEERRRRFVVDALDHTRTLVTTIQDMLSRWREQGGE